MVDKEWAARLKIPNPHGFATVIIFSIKGTPPKSVQGLFDTRAPVAEVNDRAAWTQTDLVIYGTGGLTARRERLSARLGATYPVLLATQKEWAYDWIADRLNSGLDVRLFLPYPGCEVVA